MTVTTPFGAFKYRRMNFGLCNATQSFQRFIYKIISAMENFCFAYVDDLLVASTDAEEHKSHLRMLFQRLADYGLIIIAKKSQIGQDDLEFLGHRITKKVFVLSKVAQRLSAAFLDPQTLPNCDPSWGW